MANYSNKTTLEKRKGAKSALNTHYVAQQPTKKNAVTSCAASHSTHILSQRDSRRPTVNTCRALESSKSRIRMSQWKEERPQQPRSPDCPLGSRSAVYRRSSIVPSCLPPGQPPTHTSIGGGGEGGEREEARDHAFGLRSIEVYFK